MTRKTVSFKPQARKPAASTDAMNAWVEQGAESSATPVAVPVEPKEPIKRLSIDLPASVHRDLMMYCASNGTKAAQVVRSLLEDLLHKS